MREAQACKLVEEMEEEEEEEEEEKEDTREENWSLMLPSEAWDVVSFWLFKRISEAFLCRRWCIECGEEIMGEEQERCRLCTHHT